MRLSLMDVVREMPACRSTYRVDVHRAISRAPTPPKGYVWPDVEVTSVEALRQAKVVLVSAPGAMGKSAAAKSVAKALDAIYVDLAKLNVGSGTLVGELVKALGPVGAEKLRDEVRRGVATVVLDSTDEAQLRSGTENYFEFLKDVEWFVGDGGAGPRVVLLGRSDSIGITELALKLRDLSVINLELEPLTYRQACEYIGAELDEKKYPLHREQPEPFGRLRDALLCNLARALSPVRGATGSIADSWDEVESLLGYPPVLSALAVRLNVGNPQNEFVDLAADTGWADRRRSGVLLQEILEFILDRESKKVRDALGESLGIRANSPDGLALYGRDEQAARLLAVTGTRGLLLDRPARLDGRDREKYETLVEGFVLDHPFLRGREFANLVFGDYLRSWAVSSPMSALMARDRAQFLASLPPVGPFFTRFLAALSEDPSRPSLPEDLVDDAVKSHASGSSSAASWFRHRDGQDGVLRTLDSDYRLAQDDIEFVITEASGALSLKSPLSRIVVNSDYGLVLRAGAGGQLDIGPEVWISADEIVVEASVFRVMASDSSSFGAVMLSKRPVDHDPKIKVIAHGAHDLLIAWPDPWHPWNTYRLPADAEFAQPIGEGLAAEVVVAVRKLLVAFHRSMRDAPSVSADKVDRVLVGENEVAQSVLAALIELGVIRREGVQYRLLLSCLGELGVSWANILSNEPVAALGGLCERVINTDVFVGRHLQ